MNSPPRIGDRIGAYKLQWLLGRGGMGEVWKARRVAGRGPETVALKLILATGDRGDRARLRFIDEARITARIDHPNVVRVTEAGAEKGCLFVAFDYVRSVPLTVLSDARHAGKPVNVPAVVTILEQAARGLHAAHEAKSDHGEPLSIVHRDVSPHNLLLSLDDGITRVIDFGIAKALERVSPDTTAGTVMGKVRYMSPEHASGRTVDRRTDIWSLGAVGVELVWGVVPYEAPSLGEMLRRAAIGAPVVLPPVDVPPFLREALLRAVNPDPALRFATALEFANTLVEGAVAQGVPISPAHTLAALPDESGAETTRAAGATPDARATRSRAPGMRGVLVAGGALVVLVALGGALHVRARRLEPVPQAAPSLEPAAVSSIVRPALLPPAPEQAAAPMAPVSTSQPARSSSAASSSDASTLPARPKPPSPASPSSGVPPRSIRDTLL